MLLNEGNVPIFQVSGTELGNLDGYLSTTSRLQSVSKNVSRRVVPVLVCQGRRENDLKVAV